MEVYNKVKTHFQVTLIDKTNFFENICYYFKEFSKKDHIDSTITSYE